MLRSTLYKIGFLSYASTAPLFGVQDPGFPGKAYLLLFLFYPKFKIKITHEMRSVELPMILKFLWLLLISDMSVLATLETHHVTGVTEVKLL